MNVDPTGQGSRGRGRSGRYSAIPLWQRMEQQGSGRRTPEFMSTHPNPGNRIERLHQLMPQAMAMHDKYCGPGKTH